MVDKKLELNDDDLENVTGGAGVGNIEDSSILNDLEPGRELILEDWWGKDLAKLEYAGSYEKHVLKGSRTGSKYYYVMCLVKEIYVDEIEDAHGNKVNVGQTAEFSAQDLDYFENR